MQNDLSHITKQIQKNTASITEARRQAEKQRLLADQMIKEGNDGRISYYEQEATRFDQQAIDLEAEIDQLQTIKARVEKQIADLEAQRATISAEHTDRLAQIDHDIIQLRGSGMML